MVRLPHIGQDECKARPTPCELCGEQVKVDQLEAHLAANVGSHMLVLLKENKSLKKDNESLRVRVHELERQQPGVTLRAAASATQAVSMSTSPEGGRNLRRSPTF